MKDLAGFLLLFLLGALGFAGLALDTRQVDAAIVQAFR